MSAVIPNAKGEYIRMQIAPSPLQGAATSRQIASRPHAKATGRSRRNVALRIPRNNGAAAIVSAPIGAAP